MFLVDLYIEFMEKMERAHRDVPEWIGDPRTLNRFSSEEDAKISAERAGFKGGKICIQMINKSGKGTKTGYYVYL